uniref:Uncharacterized protein n=1 Tax=Ciona savignyi TaxID=51511 RepID=H2YVX1_CIOSA
MRIYAGKDDPKCLVRLYKTYLDLVPSSGPFYRRPLQTTENSIPRFSFNPVGINKLRETFKQLFSSDRPASLRKSGKATTVPQPPSDRDASSSPCDVTSPASNKEPNPSQALYDAITEKLMNSGHIKWRGREASRDSQPVSPANDVTTGAEPADGSPLSANDVMERIRRSWHNARRTSEDDESVSASDDVTNDVEGDDVIKITVPSAVRVLVVERGGKRMRFELN